MKKIFSAFLAVFTLLLCTLNIYADGESIPVDMSVTIPKSQILMEVSTGQVLYENDSRVPLPTGTLNKLMTALLSAEAIERGEMSLDTVVTAGNNAYKATGAVIWLESGDKITVDELLKGIIVGNANDASIAIAEHIAGTEEDFAAMMTSRAKELGMISTDFHNSTGYDSKGQCTTAYDMALLMREITTHEILIPYMTTYMDYIKDGATELVNTNLLVRDYKGFLGGKLSFSDAAGYSVVAAAERDGLKYVAVVLGCSDKDMCFTEAKALLNKGFSGYELVRPKTPEEYLAPIKIKGGVGRSIQVTSEKSEEIIIPVGRYEDITTEVSRPEYIEAPVASGQIVGEIVYSLDDKPIYRENLVATENIAEMNFFTALCILLKNMIMF